MKRSPRLLLVAALALALVGAALLGGPRRDGPPLDPRSDGPLGTSALVALVEGLGGEVELAVGLPGGADDIALLLRDRLDDDQAGALLGWVRAGGTLVVTDPGSRLAPPAEAGGPLAADEVLSPGSCTVPAFSAVAEVDAGSPARYPTVGADASCFGDDTAAFVVTSAVGEGRVVAVGGAALVTNERLGRRDNAVLAAALLAPRAGLTVRFVDPPLPAGGGDKSLYDLVSDDVRRFGLQLGVAFALYAIWRAIRLGRPVAEPRPVEIAGSELVGATGRLLERTRAPGPAAEVLRADLRRALAMRFGLSAGGPPSDLVDLLRERTSLDAATLERALSDHAVTTDAELVVVARAVVSVHQEVLP